MSRFTASGSSSRLLTAVKVTHHDTTTELHALIDSGADESLIDWAHAKRLGLGTEPLEKPIKANELNGQHIFSISHVTEPLELLIGNHWESQVFHVFDSPSQALVFGAPVAARTKSPC